MVDLNLDDEVDEDAYDQTIKEFAEKLEIDLVDPTPEKNSVFDLPTGDATPYGKPKKSKKKSLEITADADLQDAVSGWLKTWAHSVRISPNGKQARQYKRMQKWKKTLDELLDPD